MRRIYFLIIALLVLTLLALYGHALSSITVDHVTVERIDITTEGLALHGQVDVANNGLIPVRVNELQYFVILDATGNELLDGTVRGSTIPPRSTTTFNISSTTRWTPTLELARTLLEEESTITLSGTLDVSRLHLTIPFTRTIDLREHLLAFLQKQADALVETVRNLF